MFLCISGEPSKWYDKNHPDYVPSIFTFPVCHKQEVKSGKQSDIERYERALKRKTSEDTCSQSDAKRCKHEMPVSVSQCSTWSTVENDLIMSTIEEEEMHVPGEDEEGTDNTMLTTDGGVPKLSTASTQTIWPEQQKRGESWVTLQSAVLILCIANN